MYIINKLEEMLGLYDDNTDGILAKYFLHHLDSLQTITTQKCKEETGVSKASLHRFYSKAGFNSLKDFLTVLDEEYFILCQERGKKQNFKTVLIDHINAFTIEPNRVNLLNQKMKKANKIVFYGNIEEIYLIHSLIHNLRVLNKEVLILNNWKYVQMIEIIQELQSDDVLIMIDTSLSIQNYHETSMNYNYLIPFELLNKGQMQKFFIGNSKEFSYQNFKIINTTNVKVNLLLLEQYIIERM